MEESQAGQLMKSRYLIIVQSQSLRYIMRFSYIPCFPNGKALEESTERMISEQIWSHICKQVMKDLWEDLNMPAVFFYLFSNKKMKLSEELKAKH